MTLLLLRLPSLLQVAITFITLLLLYLIRNRYGRGLSHVPGPWLASCTDLWRIFTVSRGASHRVDIDLHQKYGPLVRLAPKVVSVADPEEIQNIYSVTSKFFKSTFYVPFSTVDEEGLVPDPFVLTDKAMHSRMKKNGGSAYAMSSIVKMEGFADRELDKLFKAWDESYAKSGQVFDMGRWMLFYTADTVFAITFGQDFGFLAAGADQSFLLDTLEKTTIYSAVMGQMPSLHEIVKRSSYLQKLFLGSNFIAAFGQFFTISSSQIAMIKEKQDKGITDPEAPITFVERLLQTQKVNPSSITDRELETHAIGNIVAGGDTTSIALRSIFYRILNNPTVHAKLLGEIESFNLSLPVSYEQANNMPYLQAVIREGLRVLPSVGMMLARTVPKGGATVCGKYLPEGTDVGINPYIANSNPQIFPDPLRFLPERWLTTDQEQLKLMNRAFLTFGQGQHTCSGKHISLMEMSKLIPSLLLRYNIQLADKNEEQHVRNYWFMFPSEIHVTISRR